MAFSWPLWWPRDSLCTDLVLFVEFVSGREKTSNVLGHFHILLQVQRAKHWYFKLTQQLCLLKIKTKFAPVFLSVQGYLGMCLHIFLFNFPLETLYKAWDHLQTQHSPCEKWWCRLCLLSPLWWLTCCVLWCQCPSTCHTHKNAFKNWIFPHIIQNIFLHLHLFVLVALPHDHRWGQNSYKNTLTPARGGAKTYLWSMMDLPFLCLTNTPMKDTPMKISFV